MTTWQILESRRQQSGLPIARVSWRCQHHPALVVPIRNVLPRLGRCLDCHGPIALDSRRCLGCATATAWWFNDVYERYPTLQAPWVGPLNLALRRLDKP